MQTICPNPSLIHARRDCRMRSLLVNNEAKQRSRDRHSPHRGEPVNPTKSSIRLLIEWLRCRHQPFSRKHINAGKLSQRNEPPPASKPTPAIYCCIHPNHAVYDRIRRPQIMRSAVCREHYRLEQFRQAGTGAKCRSQSGRLMSMHLHHWELKPARPKRSGIKVATEACGSSANPCRQQEGHGPLERGRRGTHTPISSHAK